MAFKETFLFVCQRISDGEIFIETKENVESLINNTPPEKDLDFETIGKIPLSRFQIDSDPNIIQFYKPDTDVSVQNEVFLLAIKYKLDYKL